MILTRRFYMVLILIILLMGSGYAFAPLFTIGQGLLFSSCCRCWQTDICFTGFVGFGHSVNAPLVFPMGTKMR